MLVGLKQAPGNIHVNIQIIRRSFEEVRNCKKQFGLHAAGNLCEVVG